VRSRPRRSRDRPPDPDRDEGRIAIGGEPVPDLSMEESLVKAEQTADVPGGQDWERRGEGHGPLALMTSSIAKTRRRRVAFRPLARSWSHVGAQHDRRSAERRGQGVIAQEARAVECSMGRDRLSADREGGGPSVPADEGP
jgi:hypothetical protein